MSLDEMAEERILLSIWSSCARFIEKSPLEESNGVVVSALSEIKFEAGFLDFLLDLHDELGHV